MTLNSHCGDKIYFLLSDISLKLCVTYPNRVKGIDILLILYTTQNLLMITFSTVRYFCVFVTN
jgi:hypothetical protein